MRAPGICDLAAELGAANDRMIAIQMEAYPSGWAEADRREMAELYFQGSAVS